MRELIKVIAEGRINYNFVFCSICEAFGQHYVRAYTVLSLVGIDHLFPGQPLEISLPLIFCHQAHYMS